MQRGRLRRQAQLFGLEGRTLAHRASCADHFAITRDLGDAATSNDEQLHVELPDPGEELGAAGELAMDAPSSTASPAEVSSTNGLDSGRTDTKSKSKKKDDRSIDNVLKSFGGIAQPEEKLAGLCQKYSDLLEDFRSSQSLLKQMQRKCTGISKERDQLQTENGKLTLAKSKLESLCRELQRHNKLIKEESIARAREEEEKRKEVATKFQTTISDIQCQMSDNSSRNTKLREENLELTGKLKHMLEQFELREQQVEKLVKHKELEQQLVEARLAQLQLLAEQEKDKNSKEKQLLLEELIIAKTKVEKLEESERHLKTQLSIYTDKYTEFQSTLTKSNEVFSTFKSEMEKMTKKIKKLEKDAVTYKTKWEESCQTVISLSTEKQQMQKQYVILFKKTQQLENLCRALQAERKSSSPLSLTDGSSSAQQHIAAASHSCCADGACSGEAAVVSPDETGESCCEDSQCSAKHGTESEKAQVDGCGPTTTVDSCCCATEGSLSTEPTPASP